MITPMKNAAAIDSRTSAVLPLRGGVCSGGLFISCIAMSRCGTRPLSGAGAATDCYFTSGAVSKV